MSFFYYSNVLPNQGRKRLFCNSKSHHIVWLQHPEQQNTSGEKESIHRNTKWLISKGLGPRRWVGVHWVWDDRQTSHSEEKGTSPFDYCSCPDKIRQHHSSYPESSYDKSLMLALLSVGEVNDKKNIAAPPPLPWHNFTIANSLVSRVEWEIKIANCNFHQQINNHVTALISDKLF